MLGNELKHLTLKTRDNLDKEALEWFKGRREFISDELRQAARGDKTCLVLTIKDLNKYQVKHIEAWAKRNNMQ